MSPTFFLTMVTNTCGQFNSIEEFKRYLLNYVTRGYPFLYYGDKLKCERAMLVMRRRIDALADEFSDVISDYYDESRSA